MTKSEMQDIIDAQRATIDAQRARVKRQNDAAKAKYDCISCKLPKGTKQRIEARGLKVNPFITALVIAELDRLETAGQAERGGQLGAPC